MKAKKLWVFSITLVVMYLAMYGVAMATYPHGSFSDNPDACAACHRMHTAASLNLIKDPTGAAMCETCHKDGAGADTDVDNGIYLLAGEADHAWGVADATLLGGGFTNIGGSGSMTSSHALDAASVPPGADTGATITLKCISCHSPHPDKDHPDQYRLLRVRPGAAVADIDVAWNGPWEGEDQATSGGGAYRAYTEHDFGGGAGTQYYTKNYKGGIAAWCSGCHEHYLADDDHSGYKEESTYDTGDTYGDVTRHRHSVNVPITGRVDPVNSIQYDLTTDLPMQDLTADGRTDDDLLVCLSCHRGHGTDTAMSGLAVLESRGSVLPSGSDSLLLRSDDRLMCVACHDM